MKFIFVFIFLSQIVYAQSIRRSVCGGLGRLLEPVTSIFTGNRCEEASFEEYQTMACGLRANNEWRSRYTHNVGENTPSEINRNPDHFFNRLSDQVVMQGVAANIHGFNKCQFDFFNMLQTDEDAREGLKARARAAYEALYPDLRAAYEEQREAERAARRARYAAVYEAALANPSDVTDSAASRAYSRETPEMIQARELRQMRLASVAAIPLGNREKMQSYIVRSIDNAKSPDEFIEGYEAILTELLRDTRRAYDRINNIATPKEDGQGYHFDISNGMREQFLAAGLVEQYIAENNMTEYLDSGYLCRLRRNNNGCVALTALEIASAFVMPYGAALLAARAGAIALRAGQVASRASSMATRATASATRNAQILNNTSRGVFLGNRGYQLGTISKNIYETCQTQSYLAGRSGEICNAETQLANTVIESQKASCMITGVMTALPMVPGGYRNITNMIRNSGRSRAPASIEDLPELNIFQRARRGINQCPSGTNNCSRLNSAQINISQEVLSELDPQEVRRRLIAAKEVSDSVIRENFDISQLRAIVRSGIEPEEALERYLSRNQDLRRAFRIRSEVDSQLNQVALNVISNETQRAVRIVDHLKNFTVTRSRLEVRGQISAAADESVSQNANAGLINTLSSDPLVLEYRDNKSRLNEITQELTQTSDNQERESLMQEANEIVSAQEDYRVAFDRMKEMIDEEFESNEEINQEAEVFFEDLI